MSGVQLRLLGAVEVTSGTDAVDLGGIRPIRVLLALYAAEARRLDLAELADRCFDAADRPHDPVPAIRSAVRRVRRALGDAAVKTRSGGYELDLGQIDVDIDRFEARLAAGRSASDPVAAVTYFRQALDVWTGEPFGTHGDVPWLDLERFRLEEAHLMALEGWHDAHLRNGTVTDILPTLESTARSHPLRERFHRQLMEALYLADRQADALRAFQGHREALAEAGLEPSDAMLALEQRIVVADPTLRSADRGRPLRGYRILERLGEGAFSIVYRGNQPSVERDVAIKQIRAELANRPEFIRRFEAEAHMVARLEHPYIVPLYDYWREPGSAYLVMRLLRGGNLESAVLEGQITLEQTRRVVRQIGSALSVAHRCGIVHRDVKSANILLDEEGNAYLTDFGIALEEWDRLDPEAALSAGSPAYASPEQLRREPVGPEADVHGLGIAAFESLTGRLPFPDEPDQASLLQRQLNDPIPSARNARAELPADVDAVLQRATAKRAADRYQSVDEFVDAFEAAFVGGGAEPVTLGSASAVATEERNPFKGLRAFTEADANDFAGRARLVDQLVQAVADHRLVAVVGPSGSGKSSVVRAGLMPALRSGAVEGSSNWFVATVLPGAHPHEELEAALFRISTEPVAGLLQVLSEGDRGVCRALRQTLPEGSELLLVIDQFEEIFTLLDDEASRRQLLDALAAAVSEERSRLRIVLTLRADFYDRPLRYASIGRLVRDATIPVLPLAADELERAIVDPANAVGCEIEQGLVSEIVADVSDQPGALPMLQYALTELYERRVSGVLTQSAYREIGGVAGALASRADELFTESTPDEQVQLRRLFGRLVTFGEGTEDTRRRVLLAEFGTGVLDVVIARFGGARLLSFDRDPVSREPTVEVAHEALISEWPRLKAWLDDDRDGLRIHRHLTETARAWETLARDEGELYRSGRLETAKAWVAEHGTHLNSAEKAFFTASLEQRAAEREVETQTNRRLRRLLVGVGAVALVALVAGAFAFVQRGRANDQARAAETSRAVAVTERLAADSAALAGEDVPLSLLLAIEANQRNPGPVGLGALQQALAQAGGFLGFIDEQGMSGVRWLGDGRVVLAGSAGLVVADLARGNATSIGDSGVHENLHIIGDGNTRVISVLEASGDRIAYARTDDPTTVEVWTVGNSPLATFHHASAVDAVVFLGEGDRLATLDVDGWLSVFDVATGEVVWRILAHPEVVYDDVDYSVMPDDAIAIASGSPAAAVNPLSLRNYGRPQLLEYSGATGDLVSVESVVLRRWVAESGDERSVNPFLVGLNEANQSVFSPYDDIGIAPDGQHLVGVMRDTIVGRPLEGPELFQRSRVETAGAMYGNPKPDRVEWLGGDMAWVLLSDGRLGEVDWQTGELVSVIDSGLTGVTDMDISADGRRAVIVGNEGATVLALNGDGLIAKGLPRLDTNLGAILADGTVIADYSRWKPTGWEPGPWWDPSADVAERVDRPQSGDDEGYYAVGFPWGERFFGALNFDFAPVLFDAETHTLVVSFDLPGSWTGQAVAPDSTLLAFGTDSGVAVFSPTSSKRIFELEAPGPYAPSLSFTADGERLAVVGLDGSTTLYDVATWQVLPSGELDNVSVRALRFSPDGSMLVTMLNTGEVEVRDPVDFTLLRRLLGASQPLVADSDSFIFDEFGHYLITTGDSSARLWDLTVGVPIGVPFPNDPDFRMYGTDGLTLLTAVGEFMHVWELDFASWPALACKAAGRNLTRAEWDQYGPSDEEYRATCAQWELAAAN